MDALGLIDDELIEKAMAARNKVKKQPIIWKKWGTIAACLTLVLAIGIMYLTMRPDNEFNPVKFDLVLSSGNITVNHIKDAPAIFQSGITLKIAEDKIFSEYNTAIFRGTITEILNIEIDFNGVTEYRAIAKIEVEKVYRGNCSAGEIISVLLPCPIGSISDGKYLWVEDTDIVRAMCVGMSGIFMPLQYNETSCHETNGETIYWLDIADYGFSDGQHFAFLETKNGLKYAYWTYASIARNATLDEVEQYVIKMIE